MTTPHTPAPSPDPLGKTAPAQTGDGQLVTIANKLPKDSRLAQKVDVTVVAKRCVYLNDFRIVGGKPWHAENLPQHSFTCTVADVLQAMPMLQLKAQS